MEPDAVSATTDQGPDLSVLERIEGELFAVERALEQIDQGVYDGFTGIGEVAEDAAVPEAQAAPTDPAPVVGGPAAEASAPHHEGPTGYL